MPGTQNNNSGTHFHIYRLDPANGKVMWNFYREDRPVDVGFQGTQFVLRFDKKVEAYSYYDF